MMFDYNCIISHSKLTKDKPTHAVILLAGRGFSSKYMFDIFNSLHDICNVIIFSIEPENEWYPIPNGFSDQENAVVGLKQNIPILREYVKNLLDENKIEINNTILVGFSAGAVVALELATRFQDNYNLVVCHSGAILCPDKLTKCTISTNILLFHNEDDVCFSWNERYLPMRDALIANKYNVITEEKSLGGHLMCKNEIDLVVKIIHQVVA